MVAVVVTTLLLAGCNRSGSGATLDERVDAYWELKQSKRWEEVYEGYLDPQVKDALTKDAFLRKRLLAFDVLDFKVTETKVEGDNATVIVANDVNIPIRGAAGKVQMLQKSVTTEDPWVRRDGVWYIRLSE